MTPQLVEEPDLVDEQHLPDEADDDEAHGLRHEQHAADDAVDPRAPLHEQRKPEASDVERRDEEDDIGDRDAKALQEKRIVQHPPVVGRPTKLYSPKPLT